MKLKLTDGKELVIPDFHPFGDKESELIVKPAHRRILFDMSSMINNDMFAVTIEGNSPVLKDLETLHKYLLGEYGGWSNTCHILVDRPVFKIELQKGFNPAPEGKRAYRIDEVKEPSITHLLDAIYAIGHNLSFSCAIKGKDSNFTSADSLVMFIGSSYYDCMSGGMPSFEIAVCRYLIKTYGISLDLPVYPAPEETDKDFKGLGIYRVGAEYLSEAPTPEISGKWYNLRHFMKSTEKSDSIWEKVPELLGMGLKMLPEKCS